MQGSAEAPVGGTRGSAQALCELSDLLPTGNHFGDVSSAVSEQSTTHSAGLVRVLAVVMLVIGSAGLAGFSSETSLIEEVCESVDLIESCTYMLCLRLGAFLTLQRKVFPKACLVLSNAQM